MAFHDGLFQLGMDLDRGSSTAQTEETHALAVTHTDGELKKDCFCERNGIKFAETRLLVCVLYRAQPSDIDHIEQASRRLLEVPDATLLHIPSRRFRPKGGVSGVAGPLELHISIHSWPEHGRVAAGTFMYGPSKPHLTIDAIRQASEPEEITGKEERRGQEAARQMRLAA
jgi:S-adenosylmethionine decarboxylase